jgi:hypothetical protein
MRPSPLVGEAACQSKRNLLFLALQIRGPDGFFVAAFAAVPAASVRAVSFTTTPSASDVFADFEAHAAFNTKATKTALAIR